MASGTEVFYRDRKEGQRRKTKQDVREHEKILGSPGGDQVGKDQSLEAGRARGLSEETLTLLYL